MFRLSRITCHFVAVGELPIKRWRCARASSSVRVGPQDGSMTCPVTISKLMNQDSVPCRMYSRLASQHMTGLHRQIRMLALDGLHPGQFVHADAALTVLGSLFRLGIHFTALDELFISARIC